MPPRTNTTARQERLGAELRKLREGAGMTARETARLLGVDQAKISYLEMGRVSVSEERIRRLASHYACDDKGLVDALVTMATTRVRGWWEEYRGILPQGFLDLSELEHHATSMRTIRISEIPGILQTEAHARAVFTYGVPEPPPADLEARVSHRVRRRTVLDRQAPPELEVSLHESAIRMRVGGRKVAREQLTHILEQTDRPNITVRVIPFSAENFAGTGWSMLYLGGPVPELDTVQLDTGHTGVLIDAYAQLKRYRTLFTKAQDASLDVTESRDLIHRIAREL
jgi:Helix-turn-helix.